MTLSGAAVARVHELFGLFFLLVLVDETRHRLTGGGLRTGRLLPIVFLAAGVGMWAATVFATDAGEYVVHSLWANILLVTGALEWARRDGRQRSAWSPFVLPGGIAAAGALFFLHLHGSVASSASSRWHALMGATLVGAGLVDVTVTLLGRGGRRTSVLLSEAPLALFCVLLLTYPQ